MQTLVKVTSKEHKLCGLILEGERVYHDLYHTGSSPDLFMVQYKGEKHKALSTDIDVEHFDAQLMAECVAKLGAKVGDKVKVLYSGSGSYSSGWKQDVPHYITKIDSSGHVSFDGGSSCKGGASIFNARVEVLDV